MAHFHLRKTEISSISPFKNAICDRIFFLPILNHMKLLKSTIFSILAIFILISLSLPGMAQAGQDSIRTFSWEGLSLSMTPDQMVRTLKSDGYTQLRVTEGKKKGYCQVK